MNKIYIWQRITFYVFIASWFIISFTPLDLTLLYASSWILSTILSIMVLKKNKDTISIINLMLSSFALGILVGII